VARVLGGADVKILVLGDTHASQSAIGNAFRACQTGELDTIFQVGDFGFWPRGGADYLASCRKWIRKTGIDLYWLPGNHEDWRAYNTLKNTVREDDDGFWLYGAGHHVAPASHSWEWDGLRFGSVGGAYSVDRRFRTEGISWFKEEVPQYSYVDDLPDRLDVLLTHEAPKNLAVEFGWEKLHVDDPDLSAQSQAVIDLAIRKTNPIVAIHGHWHVSTRYPVHGTTVIGLNQASGNMAEQASVVLDTNTQMVYNWNEYLYGEGGTPLWRS
jgi:Icc-related predicted phosphoesterase